MPSNSRHDIEQIRRAVQLILTPTWQQGGLVELRALNTNKATVSGYFDREHQNELIKAAATWSGDAAGVYFTLNPVVHDCIARSANRVITYAKHTTGDAEVTRRHWLLIDTDPKRPSGISSTDDEHELALMRARAVRQVLTARGWPDPIYADSGNGGHLLYRIDLPAEDEGLVRRVLQLIDSDFGNEAVGIDVKVHNPARISKLYGTLACKGDSLPDRPHRIARLIEAPDQIEIVPRELLESLTSATSPALTSAQVGSPTHDFDVVMYLQSHGVEVGKSKQLQENATLWELKRCPWRPQESDGGPFVIQFANGGITAGCQHDQCDGKGWDELRDAIDPSWREQSGTSSSSKGPSQAERLVALAMQDEMFHTAEMVAYAMVFDGKQRQTWRVNGDEYRLLLRRRLFEQKAIASANALESAIATVESQAIFDAPQQSVHVRTAEHQGNLYIDLCNDEWSAVEVTGEGWSIINNPPVRFVRYPGMLPLPTPVRGGNVDQLRPFINVTNEDWPLAVSWLMAALRPTGPFPILLINGEQGSCKSTTCKRLRSLIDPNSVPLRDVPKEISSIVVDDFCQAATSWDLTPSVN